MPRKLDDPNAQAQQCDDEHLVQIQLLDAVGRSVTELSEDRADADVVDQLLAFTEAHFLSEHLLMRLSSYPQIDAHCADHDLIIGAIKDVADDWRHAESSDLGARVAVLRNGIIQHIATRDRHFMDYHQRWLENAADPAAPAAP